MKPPVLLSTIVSGVVLIATAATSLAEPPPRWRHHHPVPAPVEGPSLSVAVQRKLARLGYYHGAIDGAIGPHSRAAIRRYQAANGLPVTGDIDRPLRRSLGV